MQTALMNWSGGKDSALALYHSLQNKAYDVRYLLTSLNDSFRRISMHGVREELLDQQAQRLGIELLKLRLPETTSMEEYQLRMAQILQPLADAGITKSIFGDIFLEDLRLYRENQLATIGMQGIFPLWKRPSMELLEEFWGLGFKTIVVSVNGNVLDQSFCGRVLDRDFVSELPANIDPCGENGEFHTFVFEAPYFSQPIDFQKGETVEKTYHFQNAEGEHLTSTYFFTDLLPI
ncbi:Dph6-related ATP pyrophosphatase [Runella salmonicolor]|uniref:Diphthine--ammonia ligase n=1 Tax=Runella salmonicolor TaxID=2950278 RepID=A0ABT1FN20_9BACT|nr:diphthine--ammonia ligase [Runella salmonicolor]MCP1383144.1 diphthine--ammonia ligase [Runella salmonicolor]